MPAKRIPPALAEHVTRVVQRRVVSGRAVLSLSDGRTLEGRRYFPAGKDDYLRIVDDDVAVHVHLDDSWLPIGSSWSWRRSIDLGPHRIDLTFKEIDTDDELARFEALRRFHYRGGGGAGRTVPIIATSKIWDLPTVLGFVEVSSSMIANRARRVFLDAPYSETSGLHWQQWNAEASKKYSNAICRISRFVIHPELRGLGLAKGFMEAARRYAAERWHYGGFRPRFLEITADMLKYYPFVDQQFVFMGDTEGNQHRLSKDMTYLVRKAMGGGDGMPEGGGGIMTLQRGYASQLMRYLATNSRPLEDVVNSLRHEPALLDQGTWEALHRLNRRPKATYVAGLTADARAYVERRRVLQAGGRSTTPKKQKEAKMWVIRDLSLSAHTAISQSSEARHLQDAFGFVGASLTSEILAGLTFELRGGEITLVCGASGSGKSLLVSACAGLLKGAPRENDQLPAGTRIDLEGTISSPAKVIELSAVQGDLTPLELKGQASLEDFLSITAKCGLAEPQLFVRPVHSLSSGQRYRLSVALAFLARPEVVIIDNFCEPLDRFTALAVLRGIKHLASETRTAVLAATAAYDRLQALPEIDQVVLLRRGDDPVVSRPLEER